MTSYMPALSAAAQRAAAAVLIAGAFTLLGGCVRIPVNEDTLFQPKESVTLGTFMATYVAEQREAAALVLENPATSARDWTRAAVPWYLSLILSFDIAESIEAEDNLERIGTVEEHLLVLAGGEDMVTPAEMAHDLYEAAAEAKSRDLVIIEEGSHPDLHGFEAYGAAYRRLVDALRTEASSE